MCEPVKKEAAVEVSKCSPIFKEMKTCLAFKNICTCCATKTVFISITRGLFDNPRKDSPYTRLYIFIISLAALFF